MGNAAPKLDNDFDSSEFLAGQNDCAEGKEHKSGRSESYDRGYSTQYQMEQIRDNQSRRIV